MEQKEMPTGNEMQPHCQLAKSYEIVLKDGTALQISMAMNVSGATEKMTEQILAEFAKCARNFYLEVGRDLNNMP